MRALAPTNESVAQALTRAWNLLSTPTQLLTDTNLVQHVEQHWASDPPPTAAEGPDRTTFEKLITAD